MNKLILIFFSLFFSLTIKAQTNNQEDFVEKYLQFILDNSEDEGYDLNELQEQIELLLKHPVNINKLNSTELLAVGIFNPLQVQEIIQHRNEYGNFSSIEEMQLLNSFSREELKAVKPFVVFKESTNLKSDWSKILQDGESTILLRHSRNIEKEKAYKNQSFQGSSDYFLLRLNHQYYQKFRMGLIAEKDPGEAFTFTNKQNGIDYLAAFVELKNSYGFDQIIIGDYDVQFGQGLSVWTGSAFNTLNNPFATCRVSPTFQVHSSSRESNYLRGLALKKSHGNNQVSLYTSMLNSNSTGAEIENRNFKISSINGNGLHRNEKETLNKSAAKNLQIGAEWKRLLKLGEFAGTYNFRRIYPELKTQNLLSNTIQFAEQSVLGFNGKLNWKGLFFFGEIAQSFPGAHSYLLGSIISLSQKQSISIVHRNFSPRYYGISPFVNAKNKSAKNELAYQAIYEAKLKNHLSLKLGLNSYHFPDRKSLEISPTVGIEELIELGFSNKYTWSWYLRYRNSKREEKSSIDHPIPTNQSFNLQSVRWQNSIPVNERLNLSFRYEHNWVKSLKASEGNLFYAESNWKCKSKKWLLSFRYTLFNVADFENRIYSYERDVLYAFSIPAFQDKGERYALLIKYKYSRAISLWVKYLHSYYYQKEFIGSGLSEIEGPIKSSIKSQILIRF